MTENRLFLLDAYALIFRAYYALIRMPRQTQAGFNTSAIFGFVNTLEELLKKENPSHIAVCFDPPAPTFRHEEYADYKGEREATPEDIKLAIPYIKEIISAYRIPILEVNGYEADDVIGTMARIAAKENFDTYMMTPDKDFGQLVAPHIFQYKPSYRGSDFEVRGVKEVCERYGIKTPLQVIDLLALMGDKIDNIPGCPGVGEKTAVKLIGEFGSVENLVENTDRLKGALRKKVEDNTQQIIFSKHLATICTDVPLDVSPDELKRRDVDAAKLFEIFDKLEFRGLAERVRKRINAGTAPAAPAAPTLQPSLFDDFTNDESAPAEEVAPDASYVVVDDTESLAKMREALASVDKVGIMTLCDGAEEVTSRYVGTGVAIAPGRAWYVPAEAKEATEELLRLLADSRIEKVCADAKRTYVEAKLHRHDDSIPLVNYYDIPLAHYLLQPEMRHNLPELARQYLNYVVQPDPTVATAEAKRKGTAFAGIAPKTIAAYVCEFADVALRLYKPLSEELKKENLTDMMVNLELPLVGVLAEMELTGVRIDVGVLNDAAQKMTAKIDEIEKAIYALAGEEFNVSSPAKVGEILFDRLALEPKGKKTKKGQYSTSEDVLEKVAAKHPIVNLILEYRRLKKLVSTYLTALPAAINPATGRVHTNYNQTVTATGRLSSSDPNLQNIPVRDDVGREIRRAFIPEEGHLFLSADYSQIELRLVADFAHDETMLKAFADGEDIHAITAAKIYHKPLADVTPNERRAAKTANFGILYGISPFGLSVRLGVSRQESKELIANYFATFPSIRKYMDDSIALAREQGYVTTRDGRKRMLPDINSRNPVVRGYAERNAINAPIQGSAADIIKRAMVNISAEMRCRGLKSRLIMQVHDELNFDVLPEEAAEMQELVTSLMEAAYSGSVRLTASCGIASNWLDAH